MNYAIINFCLGFRNNKKINMGVKMMLDLRERTEKFQDIQSKYYKEQITSQELSEVTTQPFWQSMELERKRLNQHGLQMDLIIPNDNSVIKKVENSDGNNIVGTYVDHVRSKKIYYKDGRKIYSETSDDIRSTHFLRAKKSGNGADEMVICPNCGHEGKIASYVDGCDYCHSKFLVNDFEEKVSGFFLEEDGNERLRKMHKKAKSVLKLLIVLSILTSILAVGMKVYGYITSSHLKLTIAFSYLATVLDGVPRILWGMSILTGVLFFILKYIEKSRKRDFLINEKIATNKISGFSAFDFAQNLDYKLKNIHFAENVNEVSAFAKCDLSSAVGSYGKVIDCSMTQLEFVDATAAANRREVDVIAHLKLTIVQGGKIVSKSEHVKLKMSAPASLLAENPGYVRAYHCNNCGNSVSLLNGGVCEYCGTKLDYENYSWIIEEYEAGQFSLSRFQKMKKSILIAYAVMFLFASIYYLSSNFNNISKVFFYHNMTSTIQEYYETNIELKGHEMAHDIYIDVDGENITIMQEVVDEITILEDFIE